MFFIIKNYIVNFFCNYHYPIGMFVQMCEILMLYSLFIKTGVNFFMDLYVYSTFCKILVTVNFPYIYSLSELFSFDSAKNFVYYKISFLILKFRIFFFKFLRYFFEFYKFFRNFFIFRKSRKFFNYFLRLSLLVIVISNIKSYRFYKKFVIKAFFNNLWFKDKFYLKFFFSFFNTMDVYYFISLIKNYINYFCINKIIKLHYRFMSVPSINYEGSVSIRWLAYAAWVQLYFFTIRKSYHSDIEKRFKARYYYRERMVLSYVKNVIHLIFLPISLIFLFLKKNLFVFVYIVLKYAKSSVFFSAFKIIFKKLLGFRKSFFSSMFFFLKRFFLTIFFLSLISLFHGSLIGLFLFFFKFSLKFGKALFYPFPYIKIFFNKLKLKIIDRIVYVPRFVSFGIGERRFKIRFTFQDFNFIVNFLYWYKKFTHRYQLFVSVKRFVARKRYAAFRLVFKISFIIIKYFFILLKYILTLMFYSFYSFFFSDLCFVL